MDPEQSGAEPEAPTEAVTEVAVPATAVPDAAVPATAVPETVEEGLVPRAYLLRMTTESPLMTDDGEPTFRLPRSVSPVEAGASVLVKANTVHLYRNDLVQH